MAFRTAERQPFAYNFEFITNEYAEKDISIFGYYGMHPSDGPDEGLYYIINHRNNTTITVNEISRIASFTPFLYNNSLYCKGVNTSFWSSHEYVLKVDLTTNSKSILTPDEPYKISSLSLGYHINDVYHIATNTYDETPSFWALVNDTKFSLLNEFNFSYNLGVNYIDKLIPSEEKLFFTCNHGLYSMFDDCRLEASFNNKEKLQQSNHRKPIAVYNNKIAFADVSNQNIVFKIFDSEKGTLDSLVGSTIGGEDLVGIGPYVFFKRNSNSNQLKYFDLKTLQVFTNSTFSDISTYSLVSNGKSAMYSPYGEKVFFIDFEKNSFDPINLTFKLFKNIKPGYDGSYYIIETSNTFDSTLVRLITKDKAVSTIYNGPGRYSFASIAPNGNAAMIILNKDGNFIVSNDLVNTYVPEVNQNIGIDLLCAYKNKFILRFKNNLKNEYWLYEAFKPLVKLFDEPNPSVVLTSMTDSLAFFVVGNQNYSVIRYNLNTYQTVISEPLKKDYDYSYISFPFKINDHQFLLNSLSKAGQEPAILDLSTNSITLLSDINPGTSSSYPSNYIIYKNWVYFTAIIADKSNQWFRFKNDISNPTIEQVTAPLSLTVFPSPTSHEIMMDKDLDEVTIFGVDGQSLLHTKDYKANQRINVNHLSNGTYYVIGSNKSNHFSGKVVVIH